MFGTEVILTEEELQKLCKEWQERLGISEWRVKVKVSSMCDMPRQESAGCVSYTFDVYSAIIWILDKKDWRSTDFNHDMEKTLVHELVHILFIPFTGKLKEDSLEHSLMEVAVNKLAYALVNAKREGAGHEKQEV